MVAFFFFASFGVCMEEKSIDSVDWTNLLKTEAIWIAQTMAMITLSLAVGRILTLLTQHGGVDLNLSSHGDWQKMVNDALREGPTNGSGTVH